MHDRSRQVLTAVAALAAAGGITAGIAGAAKTRSATGGSGPPGTGPYGYGDFRGGPPHEAELTGDAKTEAEAAALAAVPGGKVLRSSEEDPAEGTNAKYEVHVADADGAPVRVLLDADFKVVDKRSGPPMGARGPDGRHARPAPLTGDAADKAKAAALAAVAGGTVRAAFPAPPGSGGKYVVFVTRSGDRPVIVLLDADFKVVRQIDRPGFGGPRGHDGWRHDGDHDGPPPGAPGPAGAPAPPPPAAGTSDT